MRVPILMYHWFADPALPPGVSPEFGMKPADFRAQMAWLAAGGASVVGLDRLVAALHGGPALPRRPLVITFDDAYADFHDHALPPLVEHRLPAALFVVSGLVGRTNVWDRAAGEPERPLLDWPRLRAVAAAPGIEIGSHSVTHPDLRTLSDTELAEECRASKAQLEDGLGRPVRYFAYPFGRHDDRVKAAARAAGYEAACAVLIRPADFFRSDDFALRRVIVHATKGMASFRLRARLAAPDHARGEVTSWSH